MALVVKNPPANAGDIRDTGSSTESGKSPGRGHGNPLQFSCVENPRDREALWAMAYRVAKSWIQLKRFSMHSSRFLSRCRHNSVQFSGSVLSGSL